MRPLGLELPDLEPPGLELPDLELPDLELPDLEPPGLELPDLELPDLEPPGRAQPAVVPGPRPGTTGTRSAARDPRRPARDPRRPAPGAPAAIEATGAPPVTARREPRCAAGGLGDRALGPWSLQTITFQNKNGT